MKEGKIYISVQIHVFSHLTPIMKNRNHTDWTELDNRPKNVSTNLQLQDQLNG